VSPRLSTSSSWSIAKVAQLRGDTGQVLVAVSVHSGFRAPAYNRRVPRARARQPAPYGDAADVTIDGERRRADTRARTAGSR
jgi:uncharacterized protein YcbK (DUF882 family)